MFSILKALVKIAQNLQRIVEILEIVHKKELYNYELSKRYPKKSTLPYETYQDYYSQEGEVQEVDPIISMMSRDREQDEETEGPK